MKWKHLRRMIIVLACAMMAPLAFGQAPAGNTSMGEHTGRIQHQIPTGAAIVGTVTAFNPGLRNVEPRPPIIVQSSADSEPVSYMLARKVLFEDKNGRAFSPRLVRPGTRVKLDFDRRGKVNRVIVEDNRPDLRGRLR
jgi:hypothetical protein